MQVNINNKIRPLNIYLLSCHDLGIIIHGGEFNSCATDMQEP